MHISKYIQINIQIMIQLHMVMKDHECLRAFISFLYVIIAFIIYSPHSHYVVESDKGIWNRHLDPSQNVIGSSLIHLYSGSTPGGTKPGRQNVPKAACEAANPKLK